MAEALVEVSPQKLNSNPIPIEEGDISWHEAPSSPFITHVEPDQENIAPPEVTTSTPTKPYSRISDNDPQSAFRLPSPSKGLGSKERTSPIKAAPAQPSLNEFDDMEDIENAVARHSPKKCSPIKKMAVDRPDSTLSERSRNDSSPTKSFHTAAEEREVNQSLDASSLTAELMPHVKRDSSSSSHESALRDNEGLTVAMKLMEQTHFERHEFHERSSTYREEHGIADIDDYLGADETELNPDGPDLTSVTMDDTCFSNFSEMPNLDMTKFAFLKKSPTKSGLMDQATPRARPPVTPSTVRRMERTPSPTPRQSRHDHNAGDTTNLLLDFTAQIEAFSAFSRGTPSRGRQSPSKSTTEPNLLTYIQNQRSPAKPNSRVPATPSQNRQLLNLLDFELPPPPTPRSVPTVTIRELESLKSTFQSQISSLTASLSGKEAEVDSLVKAVSDAERRVGEAQELLRDERSAREHAEAQMVDWKNKGEEVQKLLQDVQAELARNDAEREALLTRLAEVEKRAEDAEQRSSELETRLIEAESKNVDMTTFINPEEDVGENKKIYSELECQAAIAEKVNEVARELHTAYKAKHEKKIKALKENYQRKADEKCKELRLQIIRLERQVDEAQKKRDDTFSQVLPGDVSIKAGPCEKCAKEAASKAELTQHLEAYKSTIENLKAKLAGLESELSSLRKSHDGLLQELEAERVEKGELVAAAEQMLALCGEKMEEYQQEELRKSQMAAPRPVAHPHTNPEPMRTTGFLGGAPPRPGSSLSGGRPGSGVGERLGAMGAEKQSSIAKPSGLRAPGGFGFSGGAAGAGGLARSGSGGKSRLMSNIERMGGRGSE
ncbi:uncharacterized protein EI97DRAFT_495548 [Westerdykella ornata]|uniref:Uncharacterized protein n=1 Tax=Westerdykella ornata TaxID=318751 RepID=A0A6A6JCW7_WESOR|nr:uncharacterized protein EI97DRAFT_495548 [Westerdykella ornata]KAF2274074.1 hypothetical protein EI97DRAFT_495548 [Westerdykella ornata]